MKVLITAGPTREPIDAVRYISNRSSGRMGVALAEAAFAAGHDTTLLLGPTPDIRETYPGAAESIGVQELSRPAYRCYRFESSTQLKQLLNAHWPDHDVLIMAAAVSDYRPSRVIDGKAPRDPQRPLILQLEPTPDLVALVASQKRPNQRVIAFALEEAVDIESRAIAKMIRKGVDAIVANPLGTMENDSITPLWLTRDGGRQSPDRMTKPQFARWLMEKLNQLSG